MKILCVILPHFPLHCEIARRLEIKGRRTIILQPKAAGDSRKVVLDFSPGINGLPPGTPFQEVLARCGDAALLDADSVYYRSVFNSILDALEQRSPLVEGGEIGMAYVGIDGLEGIYRDYTAMAAAVQTAVPRSFAVNIGIAENKFLSYLAAVNGSSVLSAAVSPEVVILESRCHRDEESQGGVVFSDSPLVSDVYAFLKNLSCDILPVSLESKKKLHEFGFHTLGQIAALPLGPFLSQFGLEGKRIWSLACGVDDTPLCPRLLEEVIEESTALSSVAVSVEALAVAVEALLLRIFARDAMKGRGIRSLNLWTQSWDSGHWEKSIRFKEPVLDVRGALPRIRHFLENYPQPGPVEQMSIMVTGLSYGVGRQRSIFTEVRAQDSLLADIKELEQRLSARLIFRIKEVEPWSRIPERRFALTPAAV